jgi:hypothetical protein
MRYGLWNMIAEIEINEFIHLNVACGKQKNGRRDSIFSTTATRFTAGKG